MQNNHRKSTKAKIYGVTLAVCAVIAGVSAYLFASDASEERDGVVTTVSAPEQAVVQSGPSQHPQLTEKEPEADTTPAVEETLMPVTGHVLHGYAADKLSYNTTTRDWRTHSGVDIAAPLGQQVKAARSGTVMSVYEDEQYGHTVVLQHTGGYTTTYSGLAEDVPVYAGKIVAAGEVLGQIGTTALVEKALEPHLHFEVCQNGESIDPAGFLY